MGAMSGEYWSDKAGAFNNLNLSYDKAILAAKKENSALTDYYKSYTVPMETQSEIGGLNSRGLGRSYLGNQTGPNRVGGQGSDSLLNLALLQQQKLGSADTQTQKYIDQLKQQQAGAQSDLSSNYTGYEKGLQQLEAAKNANKAGFFDFAKSGLGLASLFV